MKMKVVGWLIVIAALVGQSAWAAPQTGIWIGDLSNAAGEKSQFTVEFSEAGNPLVRYETTRGPTAAELSARGQEFKRLVPGGGVEKMIVEELSISGGTIHYVVSVSFEKTTGNTLEQHYTVLKWDLALRDNTMTGRVTIAAKNAIGQPGNVFADPTAQVVVYGGTLTRQ